MPEDITALPNLFMMSQGCIRLLMLKQHLKELTDRSAINIDLSSAVIVIFLHMHAHLYTLPHIMISMCGNWIVMVITAKTKSSTYCLYFGINAV